MLTIFNSVYVTEKELFSRVIHAHFNISTGICSLLFSIFGIEGKVAF